MRRVDLASLPPSGHLPQVVLRVLVPLEAIEIILLLPDMARRPLSQSIKPIRHPRQGLAALGTSGTARRGAVQVGEAVGRAAAAAVLAGGQGEGGAGGEGAGEQTHRGAEGLQSGRHRGLWVVVCLNWVVVRRKVVSWCYLVMSGRWWFGRFFDMETEVAGGRIPRLGFAPLGILVFDLQLSRANIKNIHFLRRPT